jgi:prolyl-tRNA synthetase
MKRTNFFIPFKKNVNLDGAASAVYMEKMGMTHAVGAGMYTHLPLGFRVFNNLKTVLNKHLYLAGCGQHQFPALQPLSMWEASGRLEIFGNSIFRFKDQHGKDVCVAPTHEVAAAFTARQFVTSYRDLPFRISQIQTKFRDETRPRGGVLRTREFTMHDLYSFDENHEKGEISYQAIMKAYVDTLTELRIPFLLKEQDDMGAIGGVKSHEFHVITDVGEDKIEINGTFHNSLEVAHIFMLGDKYTAPIDASFVDSSGASKPIFMSSFGLGIERTAAAFLEKNLCSGQDLIWSWALAPFKICILGDAAEMWDAYHELSTEYDEEEILIDDRSDAAINFSGKLRENFSLGLPIYLIYGKSFKSDGEVEIRIPLLDKVKFVGVESLISTVKHYEGVIKAIELANMQFEESYWSDERRRPINAAGWAILREN